MKTITVVSKDRIGLLADISYLLGKGRVNIEGVSVDLCAGTAVIALTIKNADKAERILCDGGYCVNRSDTLVIKHPKCMNCKDQIVGMLATQKIAVENLNMISDDTENCVFSMNVNKPRKAVKVLGGMLINRPMMQ